MKNTVKDLDARMDKIFGRTRNNPLAAYDARMAKRTPQQIRRDAREYERQNIGNDDLSFGRSR